MLKKTKRIALTAVEHALLSLHSRLYRLISLFSVIANDGVHPKHKYLKYYDWFCSHIGDDDVILDIGCNTCDLLYAMSFKCKKAYGIEISKRHVDAALARQLPSKVKVIHADATKFNYRSLDYINCVTLSNVLEHIESREEFLEMLVLGLSVDENPIRFLIRVPLIEREWLAHYKFDLGLDWKLDSTHFIEYTEDSISRELIASGLEILSYKTRYGEAYIEAQYKVPQP